jgi:hypothetical protein
MTEDENRDLQQDADDAPARSGDVVDDPAVAPVPEATGGVPVTMAPTGAPAPVAGPVTMAPRETRRIGIAVAVAIAVMLAIIALILWL